jgi:hypothetical protein
MKFHTNKKLKSYGSGVAGLLIFAGILLGDTLTVTLSENGDIYGRGAISSDSTWQGLWRWFYPEGQLLAEGHFLNGDGSAPHPNSGIPLHGREGEWRFYYPDSQIRSVSYFQNGKFHGESKGWFSNGQMRFHFAYKKGVLDGSYEEWFSDGRVKIRGTMNNGLKSEGWFNALVRSKAVEDSLQNLPRWEVKNWRQDENDFISYLSRYESGLTEYERTFRNGQPHGEWRHYYPSGMLQLFTQYESGRKIQELFYSDEGDTLHFHNFAPE